MKSKIKNKMLADDKKVRTALNLRKITVEKKAINIACLATEIVVHILPMSGMRVRTEVTENFSMLIFYAGRVMKNDFSSSSMCRVDWEHVQSWRSTTFYHFLFTRYH